MTTQQLTSDALSLPLAERVELALALWQSIDCGLSNSEPGEAIREAKRRDAELESGAVAGRSHEDVMQSARQSLTCQ